jgi:pimeloyl-ACP methyl ester carboxylesterase
MPSSAELVIPETLLPYADGAFRDATAVLARTALQQVLVPPIEHIGGEETVGFGRFTPLFDHGSEYAVVSNFPIANDLGLNMAIRNRLLPMVMPGQARVIAFPHNTRQAPNVYRLNAVERQMIADGSLRPLADKQLRTLEALGVKRISVVGDSVGTALGASLLLRAVETGVLEVGPSVLFEGPTVKSRNMSKLDRDFAASGFRAFQSAVNESGIPAYVQVQHTAGGLEEGLSLTAMFWSFRRNLMLPDNVALRQAMRYPTLEPTLDRLFSLKPDMLLSLVRGMNSRIMPREETGMMMHHLEHDHPGQSMLYQVPDRGHEVANHLPTFVLLSRLGLQGLIPLPSCD